MAQQVDASLGNVDSKKKRALLSAVVFASLGLILGLALRVDQGKAIAVGTAITAIATAAIAWATYQQRQITVALYDLQRQSTEPVVRASLDTYFEQTEEVGDYETGVNLKILNMSAVAIFVDRLELWMAGQDKPAIRRLDLIIPAFTAETKEISNLVFQAARALATKEGVDVKDEGAWDNWFIGNHFSIHSRIWCLVHGVRKSFELDPLETEYAGGWF